MVHERKRQHKLILMAALGAISWAMFSCAAGSDQTAKKQRAIKDTLDALNNDDAVDYVPEEPCVIVPLLTHDE